MTKSKALSFILMIWTLWASSAQAKSFFFEPYVGFGKLEGEFKTIYTTNTFKDFSNGFYLGGKLGVYLGRQFFIGADYHTAGPYQLSDIHSLYGTGDKTHEWNQTMQGLGIGVDYKVIRFWAGYYFDNTITDATADVTYTGTGVKVGFGLTAGRKLRANLSVAWHDMDKSDALYSFMEPQDQKILSTHVSISVPIIF